MYDAMIDAHFLAYSSEEFWIGHPFHQWDDGDAAAAIACWFIS